MSAIKHVAVVEGTDSRFLATVSRYAHSRRYFYGTFAYFRDSAFVPLAVEKSADVPYVA